MRLQYGDVKTRYCPGKSLPVTALLSQADPPEYDPDSSVGQEIESAHMLQYLHISDGKLQAIQQSMDQGGVLQAV